MHPKGIIVCKFAIWGYIYNPKKSEKYNAIVFDFDDKEIHFTSWGQASDWLNDVSD